MPLPRRAAASLVLAALAVIVVVLAGLSVIDPFHLRHARWFSLGLVFLAIVLVTAALAVPLRGVLRGFVLLIGTLAVLGWAGFAWFAVGFSTDYREVRTVADGDRRLVVLEGGTLDIDPVHSVVVRSGSGPFEQQSLVYQGRVDGPGVADLRFVGHNTVEVLVATCDYRSEVADITLDVDPVHAALLAGAC